MHPKICVLGGGSWGATIASHVSKKGYPTSIWEFSELQVREMNQTRTLSFLPQLKIPEAVFITSGMGKALEGAKIILSVVPSQFVRSTWKNVKKHSPAINLAVNFSKGIETESLMRMTEVILDEYPGAKGKIAVVSGPSHAEEVAQEIPTAVVAGSEKKSHAETIQKIFSSETFRVYTNPDVIGMEICGSLKNIFAIACGACDGLGLGDNTKSALVTRGLYEMAKLGTRMGAKQITFFGLAGMGDLVVTCFSKHSRNRSFGERIGQGETVSNALKKMTMVVEGVPTSKSAYQLIKKYRCDCPIIDEIYHVLYQKKNIRDSMHDLMSRPARAESNELQWK